MQITPDSVVILAVGGVTLNATILFTWLVMAILTVGSIAITRHVSERLRPSRWQIAIEVIVKQIEEQIAGVSRHPPGRYLPFIGTLFLFIAASNALMILPGYLPPTGSLSTTTALALCVLIAVPLYGVAQKGIGGYLRNYIQPTVFMLPFNIIGEVSRTIALAIRLYGNVMSGTVIAGVLISIMPFVFPILLQLLGLLTGLIQAYIFAVLAMVYIASASRMENGEDQGDRNR